MELLALLKFAPAVLSLGRTLVEQFTGEAVPAEAPASQVKDRIAALPAPELARITAQLQAVKEHLQDLDTRRFVAMTDGDADKLRASARPQIALQAMAVIETFSKIFMLLMIVTVAEWVARLVCAAAGWSFPDVSLWSLIAKAEPVTTMIWPPLIASFWVCASVIKKYMGVRERDKAQQFELQAGKPLSSAAATVAAAGGDIAAIIKAIRR